MQDNLSRVSTTIPDSENHNSKLWTYLKTVTDPKDGYTEIEHGRVDPGSVFVVHRVRGSGEDDTCE